MLLRPFAPLAAAAFVALLPTLALAHTESSVVAVPSGETAEVVLAPTHGCEESPTIAVRTRIPIPDATPEAVEGWAPPTATPDADGNVVIEWTGGSLPADQTGAFPITFTAPDTVGELVTFPFIQTCENGEELAWIDGDPASEYPAPRVLLLAPGSTPAETLEDVPLDAPGRDLLTAVTDVDNPAAPSTTATTTTTAPAPSTTAVATTAAPISTSRQTSEAPPATTPTDTPATAPPGTPPAQSTIEPNSEDDSGGSVGLIVLIAIGVGVLATGAIFVVRGRAGSSSS